jgi:hypothetical protein
MSYKHVILGFQASFLFNAWFLQSFGVSYFQSVRSASTWPLDLDGPNSLREFKLQEFMNVVLGNLLEMWQALRTYV